jgi:hypothetical protein
MNMSVSYQRSVRHRPNRHAVIPCLAPTAALIVSGWLAAAAHGTADRRGRHHTMPPPRDHGPSLWQIEDEGYAPNEYAVLPVVTSAIRFTGDEGAGARRFQDRRGEDTSVILADLLQGRRLRLGLGAAALVGLCLVPAR